MTIDEEINDVNTKPKTHDENSQFNAESTSRVLSELLKTIAVNNAKFPFYKNGENFSRFCERFKESFKMANITNSCVKTRILQHVDDTTYETLKAIVIPEYMKYNLDDVCEIFETAMCNPVSSIPLTKSMLYDTKQTPGETVLEFISRIREMVSIAGIPESDQDEVKNTMLVKGISNLRVKKKVAMNMEKSFEEVVLLVKEIMAVDNIIFGEENAASSSVPVMRVEVGDQSRVRHERDYSRDRSRDYRDRGRESHSYNKFERRNRHSGNSSGRSQSQERRCYICDEKGHFCRNCPQRRRYLN